MRGRGYIGSYKAQRGETMSNEKFIKSPGNKKKLLRSTGNSGLIVSHVYKTKNSIYFQRIKFEKTFFSQLFGQ